MIRSSGSYLCLYHQLYKSYCWQVAAPASPLDDRLASPELEVSLRLVSTDQTFHRFGHSLTTVGQVSALSSLCITHLPLFNGRMRGRQLV
jgi:hypothetical protein